MKNVKNLNIQQAMLAEFPKRQSLFAEFQIGQTLSDQLRTTPNFYLTQASATCKQSLQVQIQRSLPQ
jgi:hypothetical protein